MFIDKERIRGYIEQFNHDDEQTVTPYIANEDTWAWMDAQIPFFECPDQVLEETYYFRWWVYRKHVKQTEDGYVITEFAPDVPWAGKHNAIVCPVGHQLYEGRWLANPSYMEDYVRYWYLKGGARRAYSNWLGDGLWQLVLVTGNKRLAVDLLDHLVEDYESWEQTNLHESGLFWSNDDRDGMEFSISGNGLRPTLNAYMYGYARMIARTAALAGRKSQSERFDAKATRLRQLINSKLWDPADGHYKTIPLKRREDAVRTWAFDAMPASVNVREQLGYIPWYFGRLKVGKRHGGSFGIRTDSMRSTDRR